MPNHCHNRIEISGEPKDLKKIKKALESEGTCFDFSKIIPEPDYDKVTVYSTFSPDDLVDKEQAWWDWRVQNWGTKWNSYEDQLNDEIDPHSLLTYTFATAWSPPEQVISALREKFPDVDISAFFDEPGERIAGYY